MLGYTEGLTAAGTSFGGKGNSGGVSNADLLDNRVVASGNAGPQPMIGLGVASEGITYDCVAVPLGHDNTVITITEPQDEHQFSQGQQASSLKNPTNERNQDLPTRVSSRTRQHPPIDYNISTNENF